MLRCPSGAESGQLLAAHIGPLMDMHAVNLRDS